ncbi:MAG: sortase [Candidatus Daviesbacteria bacterium]
MRHNRRLIGDFLIIFSLTILAYIYYPYLNSYLLPAKGINNSSYYIQIPKIKAQSDIINNVDPWDKKIYEKALEKGVAKAKGFDNFIFAHSSLPPWKMTRTNTPFLRLGELQKGDQIIIHQDGKDFIYKVEYKKEVWPNEVSLVFENNKDYLILQTCTPLGTDWKRLLVFAKLTN